MTCKKCALQYVGSTITKFRPRFNNHKSRIRKHEMLGQAEKLADDLLYRHFCSGGHSGLSDVKIQLIDQAPVVQTMDSAIHRINRYPLDK